MNTEDPKLDLEESRECSLKIVSDNVISLCSVVNTADMEPPQLVETESRCQNGVCSLNWKPRRVA
ncbi:MAG: hypothetical protein WCT03_12110 [Candidatus Obscuribacterales bacterium]|jgi:hypothetical protein